MAIKFVNINSKEEVTVATAPLIAAYLASGDMSPNAHKGQDFGWRIDPKLAVKIKKIKSDSTQLMVIGAALSIPVENLTDADIVYYIDNAAKAKEEAAPLIDGTDDYLNQIKELEEAEKKADKEEVKEEIKEPVASKKPKGNKK